MAKRSKKTFFEMTASERNQYARRFDAETDLDKTRPLSARGRELWKRAKGGRPPKHPDEKAARVLITVEPALLAAADAFAERWGKSRSQLFAEGLRLAMVSRRKRAS